MTDWQDIATAPDDEPLLCSLAYGVGVVIAHRHYGQWVSDSGHEWPSAHIVAWMPLPEPYKAKP